MQRWRGAPEEEVAKGQAADLADEHVLGIADDGGRGADIARRGKPQQKGQGVEPGPDERHGQHRGEGQADDIIGQQGGKQSGEQHADQQKTPGPVQQGGAFGGNPGVEAAEAELGREDHQGVEQDNGRQIDGRQGGLQGYGAADDHGDGPEQGNAGPVKGQAGDAAQGDPQVGGQEDDNSGRRHEVPWRAEKLEPVGQQHAEADAVDRVVVVDE